MNPVWYLVMWFVAALALGCLGAYPAGYRRGWARATVEATAAGERHTHRKGDQLAPLPRPGRLPVAEPPWVFAGGWDEGPVSGSGEYELLTRTAEPTCAICHLPLGADPGPLHLSCEADAIAAGDGVDETPSGFTRRMAREVDAIIAKIEGDTNYWLHTHRADT
jgi:hypothetical protein